MSAMKTWWPTWKARRGVSLPIAGSTGIRVALPFIKRSGLVRTASATQVRQPIYNSAVGRWRVHEEFLGPLLAELGIAGSSNQNRTAPTGRNIP